MSLSVFAFWGAFMWFPVLETSRFKMSCVGGLTYSLTLLGSARLRLPGRKLSDVLIQLWFIPVVPVQDAEVGMLY